jgi:hypothetical protein
MLADKEHLERWIEAGRKESRADAPPVEDLLRSFSESLIHENTIKNCRLDLGHKELEGYFFNIYQPWYKASPVGMIHDIAVIMDGEKAPREDIQLILKGGQRVMLYNARTIQDIWWNIVDPIRVFIPREGGLAAGEHELEVTVAEEISAYYEFPLNMLMGTKKISMQSIS